jgi:lipid II:glycine glycyltransferase (peptidoglycan interpeptide bridge formation enzyme)
VGSEERRHWNQAIASLATGHVLQSFEWGELKSQFGWRPLRLLLEQDGEPRAAALVLSRSLYLPGLSIIYVPKGPCFQPEDGPGLRAILRAIKSIASEQGAIFVKVDPDITAADGEAVAVLEEEGFRPSPEQIQLRNTMVVDLRPSQEELLARMSQSTRRNIKLACRHGVEVVEGSAEDLPLFHQLYLETAHRDGFILRTYRYYQSLWNLFLQQGMAQVLFARWQGQVLAGCILLRLGRRVWYMFGASRSAHRELRPNQLLQWEAMRWAKAQGAESYDMWGLPNVLEPGQPMWGLYQFKKGFGGELRQWVGAYDYAARPWLRALWLRLLPWYMRMRGRLALPLAGEGAAAGGEE